MSYGNIVSLVPSSKSFLTVEEEQNGRIVGTTCNLDGDPVAHDKGKLEQTEMVEVFLDSITGKHFARITNTQQAVMLKAGDEVYQGVGEVTGWFVEAPDHTIRGRHGEKAKREEEPKPGPITSGRDKPVPAKKTASKRVA